MSESAPVVGAGAPQATKDAALTPTELFQRNRDAIVTVTTSNGFGTGVIVNGEGLIVTNLHVIVADTMAVVTLADGRVFNGVWVQGVDETRDLALLRVAESHLPTVALGESDAVRVGDRVYAIGTPEGFELSLSDGLISAVRNNKEGTVLQTTAAISHGSSGGGLFNERGELVGITTYKIRGGENLNFAVPTAYVRQLLDSDVPLSTLSAVHTKYSAKIEEPVAQPPPATPARTHDGATLPTFDASYHSLGTPGVWMSVAQRNETATVTVYSAFSRPVGHAVVRWDAEKNGFIGTAHVTYVCGSIDSRTTVVSSSIEYYPEEGGVIREVYSKAAGLNCSKNHIKEFVVSTDRWWPGL